MHSTGPSEGVAAVTEDYAALCAPEGVDVICDVPGAVEYGAHVTMAAFEHGKHVVTMNAELDGTVGPLLKVLAEQANVVFSGADGDQPGVQLNLHRFVTGIGLTPLVQGAPCVAVVTTAERDLAADHVLDGLDGYDSYAQAETSSTTSLERLLPMGVAEGCRLLRDVAKDEVLSYDDVQLPDGRLVDQLRERQSALFR